MSKLLQRLQEQLKKHLTVNDFDAGFQLLEDIIVEDGEFKLNIDNLKGSVNRLKQDRNAGTSDQEELRVEENRIRTRFLNSISELEETDLAIYWSRRDVLQTKLGWLTSLILALTLGTGLFFIGRMTVPSKESDPHSKTIRESRIKDSLTITLQEKRIDSLQNQIEEFQRNPSSPTNSTDDSLEKELREANQKIARLERQKKDLTTSNSSLAESLDEAQNRPCPPPPNYFPNIEVIVHGPIEKLDKELLKDLASAGIFVEGTKLGVGLRKEIHYHPSKEKVAQFIKQRFKKHHRSDGELNLVEKKGHKISTLDFHYKQ